MAKQKCGTCRFFQEAGLAGSGWCHHPQRKTSSDVMIMVRRNELACRDEWSRSLWAPAEASADDSESALIRSQHQGPMPPADADELRALAQISERDLPQLVGEDVLLSEARIIAEPHERNARTPMTATSSQGFDVRSAVFRAREAYRERNRARDVAARRSEGATPLPVADQDQLPRYDEQAPSDDFPLFTDTKQASIDGSESDEVSLSEIDVRNSLPERGHRPRQSPAVSSMSIEDVEQAKTALEPYAAPDESLAWFLSSAPEDVPEEYEEPPLPEIQLNNLHRFSSEPLPTWFRTDLPQMCRTCRDFRPNADGRRGWCANAWAFAHPRLVNEEDVTPCDSAFGDWWSAVDDVWMVAADVSSHSRPTPLIDRIIALKSPAKKQSQETS